MSDTHVDRKAVLERLIRERDPQKLGDALRVLDGHAEVLADLLVTCRIRCERAEKRLAKELRQKGELKP